MPPLLQRLTERKPETLDYLGVSYGLTPQLLRYVPPLSLFFPDPDRIAQILETSGICPSLRSTNDERADRRAYMRHGAGAEQLWGG